ncbi:hypothetical protein PF005_g29233 [Phytophthora fragariae]|uniref:Integrase catalytic domain-containing protein n=1 Tax=Phytophthora fragariae TaxID=53985 RepID=A0A6A3VFE1_9STRA|nr:hypothetical protein PF005_g29233 [Phytophthora fragariae]KAE9188244.1 hypothetical protein PF002_g25353 [Phytophthora fragariae]
MGKTEWLVDSGASLHMTSVRDKFVSMKELKTPVRIAIADGKKIDTVAMGTVGLKIMNEVSVALSGVLYTPEVEGSLISVAKLAEKDVVAQFSKFKCVFRYGDATVMETKHCGSVYKLKSVGDEVCHAATTSRKEPWAVVHACLGHIPFKRYEQLLTTADGVPRVADAPIEHVYAGCCMEKMREDNFSRSPEKTVKSAGVLDLIHSDIMGPKQTKAPGGCTYAVMFIDDFSRHVTVYFMKKKTEVLEKLKMFKADMENATGRKIKRICSGNGGEYTGRLFKEYLSKQGIRHEKTVPEPIDKKWWVEAINTSAWIINRIPNTVTVKTPYEIVYQKKPQLKNLKVFGALGYGHIPDEKRRKLDAKAFKCRVLGYEDGVKGYRVLHVATGQVKIVRTVKFMETTSTGDFMTEVDSDDKDDDEDVATPHAIAPSRGQTQTLTFFNDEVVPPQRLQSFLHLLTP